MFDSIEVKRLFKFGAVLLVMLAVFLASATIYVLRSFGHIDDGRPVQNVITVSGEGEMFAIPDIASFSFGATDSAKTVTEAQKKVTDKIAKALEMVKQAGVEEKDIKTVDYSVYPKYEYTNFPCTQFTCPPQKQNLVGYEVSQTISVKVRNVENAGSILESLGGTEVTNISGLQFTIDDQDALEAQAREMAIEDAREQAKKLADDLNVRLGKIVNFNESGNYPMPMYRDAAANEMMGGMGGSLQSAPKAEIPTGQNRIVSNVSITYEIR